MSTNLVTLTGLFGRADYTCYNDQGNSVVDHICIDMRHKYIVTDVGTDRRVLDRINTDHSMVVAELKLRFLEEEKKINTAKRSNKGGDRKVRLNRVKKEKV